MRLARTPMICGLTRRGPHPELGVQWCTTTPVRPAESGRDRPIADLSALGRPGRRRGARAIRKRWFALRFSVFSSASTRHRTRGDRKARKRCTSSAEITRRILSLSYLSAKSVLGQGKSAVGLCRASAERSTVQGVLSAMAGERLSPFGPTSGGVRGGASTAGAIAIGHPTMLQCYAGFTYRRVVFNPR